MEDFTGAYIQRKRDVLALLKLQDKHSIAVVHLGGIAIECYLKALLITYHGLTEWKHQSRRRGDRLFGESIKNPSHRLMVALQNMPVLYDIAMTNDRFLDDLKRIINPLGVSSPDYISLRYSSETEYPMEKWQESFTYIIQWLTQNKRFI